MEQPNLEEGTSAVVGGSAASQFYIDRAAFFDGSIHMCTATRIAKNWAITAIHCDPRVGDRLKFYDEARLSLRPSRVTGVYAYPGTSPLRFNYGDGLFADMALLRFEAVSTSATDENNILGTVATLAWKYPGDGKLGTKVGAGAHDNIDNVVGALEMINDRTDDDDDNNGGFYSLNEQLDHGDSGGPFYYQNRVLGVVSGRHNGNAIYGSYNNYTSIPFYLDWILRTIGYEWRGLPQQLEQAYTGTNIDSFTATIRECQYACENTTNCEAFNYLAAVNSCQLIDSVTGLQAAPGMRGALQYGASSGKSGPAIGYVRSDGVNAIVHVGDGNTIREMWPQGGTWTSNAIQSGAPAMIATGVPSAYRRGDGVNTVVYRSVNNQLVELALVGGQWQWAILPQVTNYAVMSDPVGYVRSDGSSAIVYLGINGTKVHIIEVRLGTRAWIATDLMVASGNPNANAGSSPHAFVRSDGYNSVVFSMNSSLTELYSRNREPWTMGYPGSYTGAPAMQGTRAHGSTTQHGTASIVYQSGQNQLVHMYMSGNQWTYTIVANNIVGPPSSYVRTDGKYSILWRDTNGHIREYAGGSTWDLTSASGASNATSAPSAYVRNDGFSSVLHTLPGNHVGEIWFRRGMAQWDSGDLGE